MSCESSEINRRRFCALPVNLRPYHSTCLLGVIETYTASIRSLAASFYTPEQIAAWAPIPPDAARWQERLARLHTVIAESDGVIAGFASYTDAGYLDFLFTHPAFARRGVASSLCHRVESELRAVGALRVAAHASLAQHGHSSTDKASNSTARSASSVVASVSAGSPCTSYLATMLSSWILTLKTVFM